MSDAIELTFHPDAKGRITLGKLAEGVSSFRGHREKDGSIVLRPYVEIPAREAWLYKNPKALAMVDQGLRESAEGKTVSLGSFAQYLNED